MSAPSPGGDGAIAIICGAGRLPAAVAAAAARSGRRVVLFPLRGWADPETVSTYPHHWIGLARFGLFCRLARAAGCRDVVLIGSLVRPSLTQLRPDLGTIRLLPRIVRMFRGGDDHLLSGVGRLLEDAGFRLIGAHEVAPDILMPAGPLGRHRPRPEDTADIARGFALLAAMGPFDVGQAAVIAGGRVIAVEAAEGTDLMLARVAALRREARVRFASRAGVLVKAPKPGQDRRLDLPSVGTNTIAAARDAGLLGIAVEARGAITSDIQELIRAADAAGLFLVGVAPGGASP